MSRRKKIAFFSFIFIVILIGSFYGWNIAKDRNQAIIDINKIEHVKFSINDNIVNTDIKFTVKLNLGKMKQYDHLYATQDNDVIYMSLSETIAINFSEKQKTSDSFADLMNPSSNYDIKKIYLVSGSNIFDEGGGVDPKRYSKKKLIWEKGDTE